VFFWFSFDYFVLVLFAFVVLGDVWYGDGASNTIEENSSVFSLIRMH